MSESTVDKADKNVTEAEPQVAAGSMEDSVQPATTALGRMIVGTVVSDKPDKTATVTVHRRFKHSRYGKYITRSSKMYVHDENNECKVGDIVSFVSCRPISKTKAWRLVRVVKKAN